MWQKEGARTSETRVALRTTLWVPRHLLLGGADFLEERVELGGAGGVLGDEIVSFANVGAEVVEFRCGRSFCRVGFGFGVFLASDGCRNVLPVAVADGEARGVLDQGLAALRRLAK